MGGFFVVNTAHKFRAEVCDLGGDLACPGYLDVGLITPGRSHHLTVSCFLMLS